MTGNILMSAENLALSRGGAAALDGVSFTLRAGEFVGLIGPNGAGKTTLLRAALGLLPAEGRASLAALSPMARARAAAYLPQARALAWPMRVEEVVALGRIARPGAPASEDQAAVEGAMTRAGVAALRGRRVTEISGGEQARVLLARALAQGAPLLVADEPAAGLDPGQQLAAMALFAALAAEGGGVIAALHDLGLAARFCTRLIVMSGGRKVADGAPEAVLSPDLLARVFGVRAFVERRPEGLVFQPMSQV